MGMEMGLGMFNELNRRGLIDSLKSSASENQDAETYTYVEESPEKILKRKVEDQKRIAELKQELRGKEKK